jgi:thiamine monophosphate kinase
MAGVIVDELRRRQILLPSSSVLEAVLRRARQQAEQLTYEVLTNGLRPDTLQGLDDLLARVTAGDDYELLFSLPENAKSLPAGGGPVTAVGRVLPGTGVSLKFGGKPIPLPPRLGWEHT